MPLLNSWKIIVTLPANRDYNGTLKLYQDSVEDDIYKAVLKYSCPCKGKGTVNTSSPDSWKYINGNTPTGVYKGDIALPGYEDIPAYGPYKRIALTPVSGNAALATNRSGLMIHGGRDQTNLWNTNGCIRVFDADMNNLVYIIENQCGGVSGTVDVIEV